jgi:hypothetical protein
MNELILRHHQFCDCGYAYEYDRISKTINGYVIYTISFKCPHCDKKANFQIQTWNNRIEISNGAEILL